MNVYVRSDGKLFGPVDFSKVSLACQQGLFSGNAEISEDRIEWLSLAEAQELLKPKNLEIVPLPEVPTTTPIASHTLTPNHMADSIQPANSLSNPNVLTVQQAPLTIPSASYAGFWRRFAALCIDGFVLFVPSLCILFFSILFAMPFSRFADGDLPPEKLWQIINSSVNWSCFFNILLRWVYYAVMESSPMQGTLGKKALSIKVTDMSGNRISFARASGRHFGNYLSSLFLCFGYFMVAFTDKKQGLHDMLAGCLVVHRDQPSQ